MSYGVRIVFNKIPATSAAAVVKAKAAVKKCAFDVEADAKLRSHVITGAMRASTAVSIGGGGGDYSTAQAEAKARRAGVETFPEPAPSGEAGLNATVSVGVEYGVYEQVYRGHQALLPAAEGQRTPFLRAMSKIADVA